MSFSISEPSTPKSLASAQARLLRADALRKQGEAEIEKYEFEKHKESSQSKLETLKELMTECAGINEAQDLMKKVNFSALKRQYKFSTTSSQQLALRTRLTILNMQLGLIAALAKPAQVVPDDAEVEFQEQMAHILKLQDELDTLVSV